MENLTVKNLQSGMFDDFDWSVFEGKPLNCMMSEGKWDDITDNVSCGTIVAGCEFDIGITIVRDNDPEMIVGCLQPKGCGPKTSGYIENFIKLIEGIESGEYIVDINNTGTNDQAEL